MEEEEEEEITHSMGQHVNKHITLLVLHDTFGLLTLIVSIECGSTSRWVGLGRPQLAK